MQVYFYVEWSPPKNYPLERALVAYVSSAFSHLQQEGRKKNKK